MSKQINGNLDTRQIKGDWRQGDSNVALMYEGTLSPFVSPLSPLVGPFQSPLLGEFLAGGPTGGAVASGYTAASFAPAGSTGAVAVQNNGVVIGAQATLNFIAGTGLILTITDSGGKINITISLGTASSGGAFGIVESPGYAFVW